jgi:hypothetical protein
MGRLTDALLNGQAFTAGLTNAHEILDVSYGGQMGWAPDLTQWVSNQAYVRRNLICILLEAPKFFQYMPNPDKWVQTLKALVELHPRSIEGLAGGLEVETEEHPSGGAGEMQREVVDVKRARSNVTMSFVEKYGMPIQTFLYNWIAYGLMDPDTKYALAGTLASGNIPTDMLADQYSMTCLFFEPDPTHKKVVKSWITTNLFPITTGEIEGKRDLTTGGEMSTLSIDFGGLSQFNLGTNRTAQSILDAINLSNANPYLRPGFVSGVSADVAAQNDGYVGGINNLGQIAVPR